jgi:hypothetical protein
MFRFVTVLTILLGTTILPFVLATASGKKFLEGRKNNHCSISQLSIVVKVVSAADSMYDEARKQFASQVSSTNVSTKRLSPDLIAFANSGEDVVETVKWSKNCGYKISMRSGGHSYAGFSSCSGSIIKCLQLDVSGLNGSAVNLDGTVTLGVGLRLADIYTMMASHGRIIPGGICQTVGLGGHMQSSALGYFGRSFGLGMDYVQTINIVTADAKLRAVTYASDPELYWAILGGSPGSWGAVVNYTMNSVNSSDYPLVTVMRYSWPFIGARFVLFMDAFMKMSQASEIERDVTCFVDSGHDSEKPLKGRPFVIILTCMWVGVDSGPLTDELFDAYFQPLFNVMDGIPFLPGSFNVTMPINYAQMSLTSPWDWGDMRYQIAGALSPRWLNNSFWASLATELEYRNSIGLKVFFQVVQTGGAGQGSQFNRNTGKTAYAARHAMIALDDWIYYANDSQAAVAQERIGFFRAENSKYWEAEGMADATFMTPNTAHDYDRNSRFDNYFPSKAWFDKLRNVKSQVDEHNLFESLMTIPPF